MILPNASRFLQRLRQTHQAWFVLLRGSVLGVQIRTCGESIRNLEERQNLMNSLTNQFWLIICESKDSFLPQTTGLPFVIELSLNDATDRPLPSFCE